MQIDCFNGDADGICALTQLRLYKPTESKLVTGVKRDINLLSKVDAASQDQITVLDVSLDKNRVDLDRLLKTGASIFYCDHHFAGEIPDSENLEAIINTSADVCTSLLINKYLDGAFLDWAIVGTFGDNLKRSATILAKPLDLSSKQLEQLESLGVYLNYNGYGASLNDLYYHPDVLFKKTVQHSSAFDFINEDSETFATLEEGYHEDMRRAKESSVIYDDTSVSIFQLPNKSWARRVSGVFGNELANRNPNKAHAVLTEKGNDELLVSVRAPLNNKQGADQVCRQFVTGGGRAAAAGINALPLDQIDNFIKILSNYYK